MNLKPCPFCGSDDVYIGTVGEPNRAERCFCCGCNDCDLRTPLFETFDETVAFWDEWEFEK